MASARRGTHGTKTPKAGTREQFPLPPYVSTGDGRKVTPKKVVNRPDRTLSLRRIEANLE